MRIKDIIKNNKRMEFNKKKGYNTTKICPTKNKQYIKKKKLATIPVIKLIIHKRVEVFKCFMVPRNVYHVDKLF